MFLCIEHLTTMCQYTYLACTKLLTLVPETIPPVTKVKNRFIQNKHSLFLVPCYGIVFQCTSDQFTPSAPSSETFVSTFTQPYKRACIERFASGG